MLSGSLNLLRAGLAARVRGDFSTAIAYYTQAIDTGELTQSQLAVVLNSRGVAYDFIVEPDKAIADFNAAIQINANYGEAYINRGLAWVKKHDYDPADPIALANPSLLGQLRSVEIQASCADNAVAVLLPGIYWLGKIHQPPIRSRGTAQMSRNRSSSLPSQCRNARTMYHQHGLQ